MIHNLFINLCQFSISLTTPVNKPDSIIEVVWFLCVKQDEAQDDQADDDDDDDDAMGC